MNRRRRRTRLHFAGHWLTGLLFFLTGLFSFAGHARATDTPKEKLGPRQVHATSAWNHGTLGAATARLQKEYEQLGKVHRQRPRLIDDDGPFPIVFSDPHLLDESDSCVTVSVLTSPNVSFVLVFSGDLDKLSERAWPIPSAAGTAEVTRCGARKALLSGLAVKLRSRRGVVEVVALESENPPPPVSELLPERNPGPTLPSPSVGRRPWLAPLPTRIDRIKLRNRSEGAASIHQSALVADQVGQGSSLLHLGPGCHRLELLTDAEPDSPPDLDAQLFTLARGEQVASDEEHSSQVLLQHCVGRPERFRLDFAGAPPHREVVLIHSTWGIPDAFPESWGPVARSQLAAAAWRHGLAQFQESPVYSSLGVRGATRLFLTTDPSACYTAIVAPIRGDVRNMAMGIRGAGADPEGHATHGEGISLTFCADGTRQATADVQAAGTGVAWIFGLFRMGELTQ